MIIKQLGYREPTRTEMFKATLDGAKRQFRDRRNPTPKIVTPAVHLYHDPQITYSAIVASAPLAFASIAQETLADRSMWVFACPTWLLTVRKSMQFCRHAAIRHRVKNPDHKIIFACGAEEEVQGLRDVGEAAVLISHNAFVTENDFKPIEGQAKKFDAIYNARLTNWKRHELTSEIESCGFIYYRPDKSARAAAEEHAILERHNSRYPGHVFLNNSDDTGNPISFSAEDVNQHLNSASVGLCLSAVEGAMLASMEYMMSGLPIVSTPSKGGRDVFFDDEYCLIVDPEPANIAAAVQTLKNKNIPREYIRKRTLARVSEHREQFVGLFNRILAEEGAPTRMSHEWPFARSPWSEWTEADVSVKRAIDRELDDFGQLDSFVLAEDL